MILMIKKTFDNSDVFFLIERLSLSISLSNPIYLSIYLSLMKQTNLPSIILSKEKIFTHSVFYSSSSSPPPPPSSIPSEPPTPEKFDPIQKSKIAIEKIRNEQRIQEANDREFQEKLIRAQKYKEERQKKEEESLAKQNQVEQKTQETNKEEEAKRKQKSWLQFIKQMIS